MIGVYSIESHNPNRGPEYVLACGFADAEDFASRFLMAECEIKTIVRIGSVSITDEARKELK